MKIENFKCFYLKICFIVKLEHFLLVVQLSQVLLLIFRSHAEFLVFCGS